MSLGINMDGKPVTIGDLVTCVGTVVSYTGSGSTAIVTVAPINNTSSTFTAQANTMMSVAHPYDTTHTASNMAGGWFGLAGNQVSVSGRVTAVNGSDSTATLTVTLLNSGASVTFPAHSCRNTAGQ
jgi:hypothetical protein